MTRTSEDLAVAGRTHGLQARPGFAWLVGPSPRLGLPEPDRSAMARRSFRSSNPEGWQTVARGHSAAKTPGRGGVVRGILEGCQNSATPPGSAGHLRLRSGGVAALNRHTI